MKINTQLQRTPAARATMLLAAVSSILFMNASVMGDPPAIMGSGNIILVVDGSTVTLETQQLQALNYESVGSTRIPLYPGDYFWANQTPTPQNADALLQLAHSYGITPHILFEYYTSYTTPIGTYSQWYSIGQAFAARFQPNSPWWTGQGISNYGVTLFEAINEPDIQSQLPNFQEYHDALKGLADGVHSVNASLKVNPGGFAKQNSAHDYTLAGLGAAIADLWNTGVLDGIDLHTYSSYWSPVGPWTYSAQHDFDSVKATCGITRDINFYASEFNYNQQKAEGGHHPTAISAAAAAKYRLTCIWDHLGVIGNSGQPVCKLANIWSLLNTTSADASYGLCTQLSPYTPTMSGTIYQLVAQLTAGMTITSSTPKTTGLVILSGSGKTMWVWQDRANWTSSPGTAITLTGIPTSAASLKVYGYDGLRATIPLSGQTSYTVSGLSGSETYMFLAQ